MNIRTFEGHAPNIPLSAYVDRTAVIIGDVELGEDSSIWPFVSIRGDINKIRIGARTNIQDSSVLHVTHDSKFKPGGTPLVIGDDVTCGHRVLLHACTIQNRVLIGMGSIVLDCAEIQSGVILGANSLVTENKVLTPGLWLGAPAKRIRDLTDEENEFLLYSAAHYAKLGKRHQT